MWDDVYQFFSANRSGVGLTKIAPHQYPFVAFQPLQVGHVNRIFWKGDPAIPAQHAAFPENGAFLMEIQDCVTGQDYQQLRSFRETAGFEFDLVAEGHDAVPIGSGASCGTASSGDGAFQAFYVCLKPDVVEKIAVGVDYSLRPKKTNDTSFWAVLPGVVLRRPDGQTPRQ